MELTFSEAATIVAFRACQSLGPGTSVTNSVRKAGLSIGSEKVRATHITSLGAMDVPFYMRIFTATFADLSDDGEFVEVAQDDKVAQNYKQLRKTAQVVETLDG